MRIALVSIGQELLSGRTVNTNAAFVGNSLLQAGYLIREIRTIPDSPDLIQQTLKDLDGYDLILTTGGLGPTGDDTTKEAIAQHFGVGLVHHAEVEEELNSRFPDLSANDDQATYPGDSELLYNPLGTAYGFVCKDKVIALPGVPLQMEQIMRDAVVPYIQKKFPRDFESRCLYLFNLKEGDVDPFLRTLESDTLEIGICPSHAHTSVFFIGKDRNEVDQAFSKVKSKFAPHVYSEKESALRMAVHEAFLHSGKTIAVAESCTGGNVAHEITLNPGSSTYFLGGAVVYSNALKERLLGVRKETLTQHGAVSEETAQEMAEGLQKQTGADIALAITGIAGPDGGTEGKPVGTVYIGKVANGICTVKHVKLRGNRKSIIDRATAHALHMLLEEHKEGYGK